MESEEIIVECKHLCDSYKVGAISKHFYGMPQFIKKVNSFFGNLLHQLKEKQ